MQTYILSLLHFNLQYCAGGLEGMYTDWPTDNDSVEDQIITESFAPVLDLLEAHPTWQMDLEMEGYMVEVLAARHPDVLDQLRALALSGQVELVSFHYSDQLWVAFPAEDEAMSLVINRAVFEANGLPLSRVVFTQEGQFAEGMLRAMPDAGYDVAVMPHNLGEYLWGHEPDSALYRYGDVLVLPGGSGLVGPTGAWQVWWDFLDDGELYVTNGLPPYLGPAFLYDPVATAEKEAALVAAEAAGGRIVSIGTYTNEVRGDVVTDLPPVLDGTWQPGDTENLYLWMGGSGIWGDDETDNGVRTTNMRAHQVVSAAARVSGADATRLTTAWKELLLGEVSDATGWNPYPTEVQYGLDHSAAAIAAAEDAIAAPCAAAGATTVTVDAAGSLAWDDAPAPGSTTSVEAPLIVTTGDRPATLAWAVRDAEPDVTELTVHFAAGDALPAVRFPWDAQVIATTPALITGEIISIDAADIAADPAVIALPTGLLRLSEGLWLVEVATVNHLAARLSSDGAVGFQDETATADAFDWRFLVVQGSEARAIAVATAENVTPVVTLDCPPAEAAEEPEKQGCGCTSGPTGGVSVAAVLAGVLLLGCGIRRDAARSARP